jgi:hypothetical protein
VKDGCDCPLAELRAAVRDYMRWESILFRSSVPMTQEQIDTAAQAFQDARDRMMNIADEKD